MEGDVEMGQEGLVSTTSDEYLEFLRKEKKVYEAKIRADEREKTKTTTLTKTMGEPIVAYEKGMPNIIHGNKKPEPKTLQEVWNEEDREKREREEE